jgi:SAM-dependent methyltransferase
LFNYVGDISKIAQNIILNYVQNFDAAIDATLGNGYDTNFLSKHFKKVYSFDIQKNSIENYKIKQEKNTILINESHENLQNFIDDKVDCIMYNLGFLPGGDKAITTKSHSTIKSLENALSILNPGGIISIAIYTGHSEGMKEHDAIMKFISGFSKKDYGTMLHSFMNRDNAPKLLIIEKTH